MRITSYDVHDRVMQAKVILDEMESTSRQFKQSEITQAYYKLGELLHILHGERRQR